MDIHSTWFLLLGMLLAGYAILDGFDLGVGILHLLAPTDHDRRLFLNSIGPIWDGNEVWLVSLRRSPVRGVSGGLRDHLFGFLSGPDRAAVRAHLPRRLDRVPQQDAVHRVA